MSVDPSPRPRRSNRLSRESSPYLLQHAQNPVDWYPWGPEAFERARREDKPIFLSVGYSTCYWCHVMERQSFENDAVAAVMNELFVNIKVDREERPDVDQLYMTGVQVQTHHGGWPMSAFLTPDRQYFYGGTYFPPTDGYGRPGFVTLLRAIDDAWRNRRDEVLASAAHFTQILQRLAVAPISRGPVTLDGLGLARLLDRCAADYDPEHGGFGRSPKFPRQTLLELLLRSLSAPALASHAAGQRSQIQRRLHHALDAMAHGGIRDQLGGAFHRYSTDARWLVPHFEIMLYDNAMLGQIYAEASRALDEPAFGEVARGVFDAMLRDFASPDGAFYTALDAEVDAREGEPYLWTAAHVRDALGAADAAVFNRVYGLDQGPNFADPHASDASGPHANVLYIADRAAAAEHAGALTTCRQRLLDIRRRRKQPLLDTKIITAWNGLMVRALAVGGAALGEPTYVAAAARAAEWLLAHHRTPDGGLVRTSRGGAIGCGGFLDDYAFVAEALLDLHDATGDARWREAARDLAGQMMRRFHDDAGGGFYFSDASATDLIVRQKTIGDSPLPSGYAVAASVMRRLGDEATARRAVAMFAGALVEHGESASRLLQTAIELVAAGPIEVDAGWASQDAGAAEEIVQVEAVQRVDERELRIRLRIADGWHIQANPAGEGLIPTRVVIPAEWSAAGATVGYPAGRPLEAPFADRPIDVYDGWVEIAVRVPPDVDLEGAMITIEYQACDDRSCQAPAAVRVSLGENRENG